MTNKTLYKSISYMLPSWSKQWKLVSERKKYSVQRRITIDLSRKIVASHEELDFKFASPSDYESNSIAISHTPKYEYLKLCASNIPTTWINGRIDTYGGCTSRPDNPNWHQSCLECNLLANHLNPVRFNDVQSLAQFEKKGDDLSWISLGIREKQP